MQGKAYEYKEHQNTEKDRIRKKRSTKQPENNEQNGNSTYLPINNYFRKSAEKMAQEDPKLTSSH